MHRSATAVGSRLLVRRVHCPAPAQSREPRRHQARRAAPPERRRGHTRRRARRPERPAPRPARLPAAARRSAARCAGAPRSRAAPRRPRSAAPPSAGAAPPRQLRPPPPPPALRRSRPARRLPRRRRVVPQVPTLAGRLRRPRGHAPVPCCDPGPRCPPARLPGRAEGGARLPWARWRAARERRRGPRAPAAPTQGAAQGHPPRRAPASAGTGGCTRRAGARWRWRRRRRRARQPRADRRPAPAAQGTRQASRQPAAPASAALVPAPQPAAAAARALRTRPVRPGAAVRCAAVQAVAHVGSPLPRLVGPDGSERLGSFKARFSLSRAAASSACGLRKGDSGWACGDTGVSHQQIIHSPAACARATSCLRAAAIRIRRARQRMALQGACTRQEAHLALPHYPLGLSGLGARGPTSAPKPAPLVRGQRLLCTHGSSHESSGSQAQPVQPLAGSCRRALLGSCLNLQAECSCSG